MTTNAEIDAADIDNTSKTLFKDLLAEINTLKVDVAALQAAPPGTPAHADKLISEFPGGEILEYIKVVS